MVAKYKPDREVTQIVIPKTLVPIIIELLHSVPHAGHPEKDRCLHQAKLEYYLLTMRKDIHASIEVCHTVPVLLTNVRWENQFVYLATPPLLNHGIQ